jgi:peptidyl-dipeptidase A
MEQALTDFIKKLESKQIPLSVESAKTSWEASVSGKDSDYKKAAALQFDYEKIFTNKQDFLFLKKMKESGEIKDSLLIRQLDVLYNAFLSRQIDEKQLQTMINLQSEIEKKFSNYRAELNGVKLSDNQVDSILKYSKHCDELRLVWKSSKKIGQEVAPDVLRLVKLRNQIAKELGFKNFHEMSLKLDDQDPAEVETLFNQLDSLTSKPFAILKAQIDDFMGKRFNIPANQVAPWHYQNRFFQEAPAIYNVDLDGYYKSVDIIQVVKHFYKQIGLPIDDIIQKSDLFEKPGKNQHAFCADIDRKGDIRVLSNVRNDEYWMNTLLHEYGHAVYDKYNDQNLPFNLRTPAHTFTTEAIANMFGRLSSDPQWIKDNLSITESEKKRISKDSYNNLKLHQLVFSRWSQVMFRFEKGLYENPDQDINGLWWKLVEKYQLVKKPAGRNEPDWASKIHIATYPCYYHNYLISELFASQLQYHIMHKVLNLPESKGADFSNHPEVGTYLKESVFKAGARWPWNEMILKATGEKLTAKYYALQFAQ